jgi:hypothetical protein
MQERMDTDTREVLTGRQKTREGFFTEPTPVEMLVDKDEMKNRIYDSLM